MGLRRIEAPENYAVLSLAEAKAHLRVDHDDDDETIQAYIAAAIDLIDGADGELQRCLAPQVWEYVLDAFPDGPFTIPLPPLIEVQEITYVDEAGEDQTLAESAYEVDAVREPGWLSPGEDGWPATMETINAVVIRFQAGYAADGSSGNSPIPPRIKQLVKLTVGHWYEHREAVTERQTHELPLAVQRLTQNLRGFR